MVLQLDDIHKSFGEKHVLKGISFEAKGGEAFGLLGRNGAGKTTSIRILMNVFPADQGQVQIDGRPINYNQIGIGYLPEERGLYPKKKIMDQLVYFAKLKGMDTKSAVKAIDYWLERLEMTEYRNKKLDTLSKGNQQKIQLITAVAHDPAIVILDEPFSGLDPVNAMLLKHVVKEEIAKGKIVLFSSHQMNYIEEFCDRIAILNEGQIAVQGSLYDIKHGFPRNELVVQSEQADKIAQDYAACSKLSLENDREVLIRLNAPEEKTKMMQNLTGTYNIDKIAVNEPTLNDIFVKYTSKEEQ